MTWLIVVGNGAWLVNDEFGILAWSRRIDPEWLADQAQPERAAGTGSPGDGEPRTQGGSPCPLRLDAIGRIGRAR